MFRDLEYGHFAAEHRGEKVNVAMYKSGKLVIQGKGTTDFVQFYLEPVLLGEARLGYEHVLDPTMLDPRIGVVNQPMVAALGLEQGPFNIYSPAGIVWVHLVSHAVSSTNRNRGTPR